MEYANHIVTFPMDPPAPVPDVIGTAVGWVRRVLGLGHPTPAPRTARIDPNTCTLVVHTIARLELTSLPGVELVFVDGANCGRYGVTDDHGQYIFRDLTIDAEMPVLKASKPGYASRFRFVELATGPQHLVLNLDPALERAAA